MNRNIAKVNDRWASDVPMSTPCHGLAATAATVKNNQSNNSNSKVIHVIGGASKPGLDQISSSNEILTNLINPDFIANVTQSI